MSPARRNLLLYGSRATAMCCALLSLGAGTRADAEEAAVALAVGEPEGFSQLSAPRKLVVDVFFGGERLGETQVVAAPSSIRFVDAASVVELIPSLKEKSAVEAVLASGSLPVNSQLVCTPHADKRTCGRLAPDVAGIIFDAQRFRMDLFVNPRFLSVELGQGERYLPEPQNGLGVVNSVAALLSGNGTGSYYNLQYRLIIGNRDKRLRADVSYSSDLDFNAEQVTFEIDRPEMRYSVGALWAPGVALIGRRKFLGAAVETQIDTRLDKDSVIGTPLVVFLTQRARVDTLVEGRVVSSRIYEAGNQQIDASDLPEGSYEVMLRIEEAGLGQREERRFFTKSRRIPPAGALAFFAYGGLLIDEPHRRSLSPSGRPYFQAGLAKRVGKTVAIDGAAEMVGDSLRGEIGVNLFSPLAWVRATAVAVADGGYGGLLQVSSAGNSRLHFNFDLRRVELGDAAATRTPRLSFPDGDEALGDDPFHAVGPAPYSQLSGTVSYSVADLRFLASASYRNPTDGESAYTVGPSLEWDFLRTGALRFTVRGDIALTEQGEAGFLGVSLRLLRGRTSVSASLGGRSSSLPRDDFGSGMVAALSGSWTGPDFAGGDLALGGGFERDPRRQDLFATAQLQRQSGSITADLVHSSSGDETDTQYSLGLQTTLGIAHGKFVLNGRSTSESMLTAEISGGRPTDRFEVLVDEQAKATISSGERIALSLPSYRAYDVRVRPVAGGLVSYDGSTRRVGLYPGSVTSLNWEAKPVKVIIGRLRSPDGKPIAHASLTGAGGWAETDANGRFQIEAVDQAAIEVVTADGRRFAIRLPQSDPAAELASVGVIKCCATSEATPELAVRDEAALEEVKDRRR